jgi:D-alanine-D-alanine ligase
MIDSLGSKIRVGVIRGGPSGEYEVSLKTGANILKNLPAHKYAPKDILIDRNGVWHTDGVAKAPDRILKHVDVIFNALHGEYGEDGKVQQLLDSHKIPYTGSKALPSSMGMNKILSKKVFSAHDIKTPRYFTVREEDLSPNKLLKMFRGFSHPSVVKPAGSGSSLGVSIVDSFDTFLDALTKALTYSPTALVEEYIEGREATCGVLDSSRSDEVYPLPPIEIIKPKQSDFFDYEAKYSGGSEEICPGNFSEKDRDMIQKLAVKAHKALGLGHYSRSDFIVHPIRGVFILEVNTLPGLTSESLFPKALKAVGCEFHDFLDHLLTLALRRK